MKMIKSLYRFVKEWITIIFLFIKTLFMSSTAKNLEILALRSQLSILQQQMENKKISKPRLTPVFRQLWVFLSKLLVHWKSCLILVKPETVVKWHKTAFKLYWKSKSKKTGRPPISRKVVALIKKLHKDNPLLTPEKIHEKLVLLGIKDAPSPNTIAKFLPSTRKPPTEKQRQSWKTFLKNHCGEMWAMDFFVIPTLNFTVLYVLIIINHQTRKIEHFGVTTNPNLFWLLQQIRNATPFDHKPKYLLHDNDSVFLDKMFQSFLEASGIKSKRTAIQSPWQNPIAERAIEILRQELLNHIIPLSDDHLYQVLDEYINQYYNTHRTHQGIDCKTPIPSPEYELTEAAKTKLEATPVLNGLYHTYKKVV